MADIWRTNGGYGGYLAVINHGISKNTSEKLHQVDKV